MSDGLQVPNHADGMGCFDLGKNKIALIRNHELGRFEEFNFKLDHNKSAFSEIENIYDFYICPETKVSSDKLATAALYNILK